MIAGLEDSAHRQKQVGSGVHQVSEPIQNGVAILIEAGNVPHVQQHAGVDDDDSWHDDDGSRGCLSTDLLPELVQPGVGTLFPLFRARMVLHEALNDPARHEVAD